MLTGSSCCVFCFARAHIRTTLLLMENPHVFSYLLEILDHISRSLGLFGLSCVLEQTLFVDLVAEPVS